MSFARGKYGVEYTRRNADEKSGGLRWLLALLGLLLVVSFILARLLSRQQPARIDTETRTTAEPVLGKPQPVAAPVPVPRAPVSAPGPRAPAAATAPQPRPAKPPPAPKATCDTAWLLENLRQRPSAERVLIEKLVAAERQKEVVVAIDTIKRLCDLPAVADLHPRLWKRLGELNMQRLLTEKTSPWTARITVKRGDTRDRLARDNRTTGVALDRLNPETNWARIRPGDVVRVLQYPKATLVIHKGLGFADLSLKGNFFNRYTFTGGARATAGVYPISREVGKTAHARLRDLGVAFSQADRADLEMFLAPESTITVSDQ